MIDLKAIRTERGLNQGQAADTCGISRTYYLRIEGGKVPPIGTAKKIAEGMGFDWKLFYE